MKIVVAGMVVVAASLTLAGTAVVGAQPAPASPYDARRSADTVVLEDKAHQMSVSVLTSVGNMAYSMTVKGQEILRFPFASLDDFKATRAGMHGIPLMGPWANRLDEQAFYANGKRYPFDMELGNVNGAIPIHGFLSRTDQWQVVEMKHDANAAWLTSRLDVSRQPAWMKQWPFAHTIEITYRLSGRRTRGAHGDHQPVGRTHAGVDRLPPVLPADRLAARRVDHHRPRAHALAAVLAEAADRGDGVHRHVLHQQHRCAEGLQPRRRVHRPRQGRARADHRDGEGPRPTDRRHRGAQLQVARRLLAQPEQHRARQPDPAPAANRDTGAAASRAAPRAQPARHAELRLLRADGGHHQRNQRGAQGRCTANCSRSRPARRGKRASG